jgi:hypothetical protein
MQNMSNDSMEKIMFWQQCSDAQVKVGTEFPE